MAKIVVGAPNPPQRRVYAEINIAYRNLLMDMGYGNNNRIEFIRWNIIQSGLIKTLKSDLMKCALQ